MPCDSQCSVTVLRGVVDWSAMSDCGISLSYSLALWGIPLGLNGFKFFNICIRIF